MQEIYLKYLWDPKNGEEFIIENQLVKGSNIIEGVLRSKSNKYFIKNGIPRFEEDQGYSKDFVFQWKSD